MACFTVSVLGALGAGIARHIVRHHEKKAGEPTEYKFGSEVKWSKKLAYLELTLWGGSFLLAGEHVIHGEVTPYPPFLTAMSNPDDAAEMFKEIGTVGVAMFLLLVIAWAIGIFIVDYRNYKKHKKSIEMKENK